jgi:hypothetical protein
VNIDRACPRRSRWSRETVGGGQSSAGAQREIGSQEGDWRGHEVWEVREQAK